VKSQDESAVCLADKPKPANGDITCLVYQIIPHGQTASESSAVADKVMFRRLQSKNYLVFYAVDVPAVL
jgi:hypothetical protein